MSRKNGIHNLRNDAVVVPDDAGEDGLLRAQFADEIRPHFIFDRSVAVRFLALGRSAWPTTAFCSSMNYQNSAAACSKCYVSRWRMHR